MGLILAVLRRLKALDIYLRAGGWRGPETIVESLEGKTIGLVGFGRVARSVVSRLHGWGVEFVTSDPFVAAVEVQALGVQSVSFNELLELSDIVSLHTLVTPETRRMINADALAKMRKRAILINTSRGELVDEDALESALRTGHLAGAGLDVFDPEPPRAESGLFDLDQVILTPHTAGFTERTLAAIVECATDNILDAISGKVPKFLKNPEVLGQLRPKN